MNKKEVIIKNLQYFIELVERKYKEGEEFKAEYQNYGEKVTTIFEVKHNTKNE